MNYMCELKLWTLVWGGVGEEQKEATSPRNSVHQHHTQILQENIYPQIPLSISSKVPYIIYVYIIITTFIVSSAFLDLIHFVIIFFLPIIIETSTCIFRSDGISLSVPVQTIIWVGVLVCNQICILLLLLVVVSSDVIICGINNN